MVTRARKDWHPNRKGYYERQIGWKVSPKTGGHFQHKFTLGKELTEAQWRESRIKELWERYERTKAERRPLWPEQLLEIAKQIAKGHRCFVVAMRANEMPITYVERIRRLENTYPVVSYVPQNERAHDVGKEALRALDGVNVEFEGVFPEAFEASHFGSFAAAEQLLANAGLLKTIPWWRTNTNPQEESSSLAKQHERGSVNSSEILESVSGDPGTLHIALKEYVRWIEDNIKDGSTGNISAWGHTQRRQTLRLADHHQDRSLDELNFANIDAMIRYWRNRPGKRKGKGRMSVDTCGNMITQLRSFLNWLHTSRFSWRKPQDYSEIKTTVSKEATEIQASLEQVQTFSLRELVLLNKFSTPMERAWFLLALNADSAWQRSLRYE
jgi:hypothetical protein